jgi:hypothetical protein
MRRSSLVLGMVALTALACSEPASLVPTSPSAPSSTGLELTGPASIAPGQAVQLNAGIRLSDGTVKLSSPGTPLQWFSSNSGILRITSAGLATGVSNGEARITVSQGAGINFRQASKEFVVTPAGTFRLIGTIFESDYPSVPVLGARVTVNPGGATYVTGFDGTYRLYGVPADAVITVTKSGYLPSTQPVQLTEHTVRNFGLVINGTRVTIAGPYTLTIDMTGICSSGQPLNSALRRRTYDATVTQNGPDIAVRLTESRFRLNGTGRGNWFSGRAGTDGVLFVLDWFDAYYYYYGLSPYPSIAERLADSTVLVSQGTVSTTGSAAGLSGLLDGAMIQWGAQFPNWNTNTVGYCYSPSAQFTLTPR